MNLHFEKYQGAGNDFIIINSFKENFEINENKIKKLCDRRFGIGADGLMLILPSENLDFKMKYFNSDGKEGSMCGNGGRCIVKYAYQNKICKEKTVFEAIDGIHSASIKNDSVQLKMNDVKLPKHHNKEIINTGSPHIIQEVENLKSKDVLKDGKKLRYSKNYAPEGTNVNFIEIISSSEINQRTYERGVENETLACGTGAIAGAIYLSSKKKIKEGRVKVNMPGGILFVDLKNDGAKITDIYLSGPAEKVFEGNIIIY